MDNPNFDIYIGNIIKDITSMPAQFAKLSYRNEKVSNSNSGRQYSLFDNPEFEYYDTEKSTEPTFVIENLYSKAVIVLSKEFRDQLRLSLRYDSTSKYQFVKTANLHGTINSQLWDAIVLTEKEDFVLKALRIIERRISRVTFIGSDTNDKDRRPVVKYESEPEITPLRSMGDGINRILTIILAMVNCENGYLLIDEFENGLHYSVQEKLWEIIFYLAERLNIQVFATTHSNDTIKAFGEVAKVKPEYNDAQLIQLRNIKGEISAVLFNSQDVEIATETDYLDLR